MNLGKIILDTIPNKIPNTVASSVTESERKIILGTIANNARSDYILFILL